MRYIVKITKGAGISQDGNHPIWHILFNVQRTDVKQPAKILRDQVASVLVSN